MEINCNSPLIYKSPLEMNQPHSFFELNDFISNTNVLLKLEGLNPAGSIKIKPALNMINALENDGALNPNQNTIIESSSGSLGIALSLVCKIKGYKFICVTDPNINEMSKQYIKMYGSELIVVDKRDENGGFLQTRIHLINDMLKKDKNLIWLNQYDSENNISAHFNETANEIFSSLDHIDYLFVGVGTSGTIMGCLNYIKHNKIKTKLVAVDAAGSVSFGFPPAKRLIPGIGASRKPEILNTDQIDEVILVSEQDTVTMCHNILDKYGLFIGGSTGSVLSGIKQYQNKINLSNKTIVAISPDFGDRYMNTIYNDNWIDTHFAEIS